MSELSTTATGLRFPGGPVVMKDGSFILGDDRAPDRHTRVHGWQHRGPRLHQRRPERPRDWAGRGDTRLQQRRLLLVIGDDLKHKA